MKKATLFIVSIVVFFGGVVYGESAYAANYNVQDIIGAYENKSSVCDEGSRVGKLVPCSRHCDNPDTPNDETEPCSVCHLVVLGHNIVEYIVFIAIFIALAVIMFAGVIYVISAGDQGMITTAKSALKSGLFGIIFVLAGWVIVNTFISVFLPVGGALKGNWSQYICENVDNSGNMQGGNSDSGNMQGGNSDPGSSNSQDKVGPASKVDPRTYNGAMACNTQPVSAQAYTIVESECYTDQEYCTNRFGEKCARIEPGGARTGVYPYFHLRAIMTTKNEKNELVDSILDVYLEKTDGGVGYDADCRDTLASIRAASERVTVEAECVGAMQRK